MHHVNELCYILIISIFKFLIFIYFMNQITLKQSLASELNFILKFSSIKRQISIPFWTLMGHKGWRKDGKPFIRCYTIALKFWDEFNSNFVLLYFTSYRSIKIWHLYLKNLEKNNKSVHLRLLFTYLHQIFSIIRNSLPWYTQKFVHVLFCVF